MALKEGEYDAADIGAALFVRAPDGVQYQTWFILHNTTDDSYMYAPAIYLKADPTANLLSTGLSNLIITLIGSFLARPLEPRYG